MNIPRISAGLLFLFYQSVSFALGPTWILGSDLEVQPDEWILVPEMETPPGVLYQSRAERAKLKGNPEAEKALDHLRQKIRDLWPAIQTIDLAAISRHHVQLTKSFKLLSSSPTLQAGRIIGFDEEKQILFLEIQGTRLPAPYDIVHRYLFFYSSYDPIRQELGPLIITIRGWILE